MDKIIQTIISHRQDMNITDFQSRQFEYNWEDLVEVIKQNKKHAYPINSTIEGPILPSAEYHFHSIVFYRDKILLTLDIDGFLQSTLFYKI